MKIKTIYEIHELAHGKGVRAKFFESALARLVNIHILLTNQMAKEYQEKYHLPKENILVAPDAVDLSIFDISLQKEESRKKYNLPLNKKIIGYYGRFKTMNMDKGLHDILESLRELPEHVIFLAMGGKKRDREEYEAHAKELGVEQRVVFIEQFEQGILAEYQKAADIFLMPFPWTRHFAYYMSPLKMFEYMAAKRPIIATDLPSIREILDESTAVLVPPGNPTKLAEAIQDLLEHPEKGEQLAEHAFKKVQGYTWERRVRAILDRTT